MMMAEESSSLSSSLLMKTPLFLFLREGFEGASAAAFAGEIVDLFSKIKTTGGTSDDDKGKEGDEEGDDNETKKKRERQRIVRLFAEDFLYFSLVSVVDDVKKRKNSSQSRGDDDDVNIFVKEALRRYATAGTISTALMVPLDIISFRVKRIEAKMKKNDDNDRSNGKRSRSRKDRVKLYVSAMKQLIKRDGAFHKGFSQSVPLIISHTINFAAFDAMKMKYGKKKLTMIESFVIGCLAKTIATGITFPLERTRALVEASKAYHREEEENSVRKNMVDGEKYKSKNKSDSDHGFQGSNAIDVVQLVLESQGVCGFYDGVFRHVTKSVHASALFFVIREQIRNLR